MVGGFKLNDPAADLAVIMAIISSLKKSPLPSNTVYLGEVGLSGELRSISHLPKRIMESAKTGFDIVVTPKQKSEKTDAIKVESFSDLVSIIKTAS